MTVTEASKERMYRIRKYLMERAGEEVHTHEVRKATGIDSSSDISKAVEYLMRQHRELIRPRNGVYAWIPRSFPKPEVPAIQRELTPAPAAVLDTQVIVSELRVIGYALKAVTAAIREQTEKFATSGIVMK